MPPQPPDVPAPDGSAAPPSPPLPPEPTAAKAAHLFEEAAAEASGAARPTPLSLQELARLFPDLEPLGLIGVGGMGVVYRARHRRLDRLVALKVLPPPLAADPQFAERFEREARALARLDHPHIVRVHDVGQVEGHGYLVLEHVDGANLRQVMAAGRLTAQEALAIVPQVCEALQYAHDQGVVHRDIKPENVLLDAKGRVKIADFGLAKLAGRPPGATGLTATGQVMGTFEYMAPEQVRSPQDVDHRADLYSLGVVFYEMLTGALPMGRFEPPSEAAGLDARIDTIVMHALERERSKRYQQAEEMRTDVTGLGHVDAAGGPGGRGVATAPSAAVTPPEERREGTLWFAVIALALGWVVLGLVHTAWGGVDRGTPGATGREETKGLLAALVFGGGLFAAVRVGIRASRAPDPRRRHKLAVGLVVAHLISLLVLVTIVAREAAEHTRLRDWNATEQRNKAIALLDTSSTHAEVERAWRRVLERIRREGPNPTSIASEYVRDEQYEAEQALKDGGRPEAAEIGIGAYLMAAPTEELDSWRLVDVKEQSRVGRVRVRVFDPVAQRTLGFPMMRTDGVWRLARGFVEIEAAGR